MLTPDVNDAIDVNTMLTNDVNDAIDVKDAKMMLRKRSNTIIE